MDRLGAVRAFLMVSGTLNRETDEIEKIRQRLGIPLRGDLRCDAAAYATRGRHCRRRAGPRRQRRSHRHGGRRLDHRRRQGGAALPRQPYQHRRSIDKIRAHKGVAPDMKAPSVRQISVPTTIAGGEFSAIAGVHQPADQGQGDAAP